MPPYKAISEITEGTSIYSGNNSHIMLNTVSTAAGSEKGLGMKAVNFNNDETAKDFMWTLTKSGEGYTMKDAASDDRTVGCHLCEDASLELFDGHIFRSFVRIEIDRLLFSRGRSSIGVSFCTCSFRHRGS